MTIKKLLLTAFVGLVGFTSFSNAGIITLTSSNGESYDQSSITVIDESITLSESNILDAVCDVPEGEGLSCYLNISPYCMIRGDENGVDLVSDCYFTAGEYNIVSPCTDDTCFTSIEIEHDGLLEDLQNPGGDDSGDDDIPTQGGVGGDSGSSGILSGGIGAFSPIISSLQTSISEFIPYVVYIGLAILGAIIGFVSIKRLMNRVRAKVLGTFSSGKRRK